jgi:hypothetical protein
MLREEITWLLFSLILAGSSFYFYKVSHELKAISLYVFMVLYAYIGINVFLFILFKIFQHVVFDEIWVLFFMSSPIYFIGSIVLFIMLIKKFNKEIAK